jgi:hypothetical protein
MLHLFGVRFGGLFFIPRLKDFFMSRNINVIWLMVGLTRLNEVLLI